jgi:HEAT repeat protein
MRLSLSAPLVLGLVGLIAGCGEFEFKNQLKNRGVSAAENTPQRGRRPRPSDARSNAIEDDDFVAPAEDRPPADSQEVAYNQGGDNAQVRAESIPSLKYRWEADRKYAYKFHIEIDDGDWVETLSGTPIYTVKHADKDSATLGFSGRLVPHRRVKSGFPDPRSALRFQFFSPFSGLSGAGTHQQHELTVGPWGEVKNIRGESQLPFLLGNLSLLIIQPLSRQPQDSWEVKEPVTIEITQSSRFPTGPRFGPRGRFGGDTSKTRIDAEEVTKFTITDVDDDRALIQKEYQLSTSHTVGGKPLYGILGKGETTFDLQRGVPRKMDFRLLVTMNSERGSVITPISVSCRLLSDEDLAKMEQEAADRIPKPLEADELAAAVEDLQTGDAETVKKALERIAKTSPQGDREPVAAALETVLRQHADQTIRKMAAENLATWGTQDNVPALLEALDTDATQVRWAIMNTLANFKDERAVEPLAERLTVGIDRIGAAKALKAIGPAAEQSVLQHIEHPERSIRLQIYQLLQHIGTEASVPALEQAVLSETQGNVVWAKKALEAAQRRKRD